MSTDHSMVENQSAWRERVVGSALWAAAGDSVGWITELGREGTVSARTGRSRVDQPVAWVRRIGGRAGVKVSLPAGTYSDDTQLRLAVCRAIRGDGVFDAEAFARVELPVWQSYALGAGNGSKAAAANLAKRGVNWFSNFFETADQKYVHAGGNGAAMRVQPHAWLKLEGGELLVAVLRDALITHGHPHGFGGAILHGYAVSRALRGHLLDPFDARQFVEPIRRIADAVGRDRQLEAFWRSAWESASGTSLGDAVDALITELVADLELVQQALRDSDAGDAYRVVCHALDLSNPRYRGSGLKTALAASVLAFVSNGHEHALLTAANTLGTDTDTIATMAGAILGAFQPRLPSWAIQDREYIEREAVRISRLPYDGGDTFSYPDLAAWRPPTNQSDGIGLYDDGLALAGLGIVEVKGKEYQSGDAIWQWMALPFGQTILAKRRTKLARVEQDQLPRGRQAPRVRAPTAQPHSQPELALDVAVRRTSQDAAASIAQDRQRRPSLDHLTDIVIGADFDPLTLGQAFHKVLNDGGGIEDAVAFAAVIAKARLSRERKKSR